MYLLVYISGCLSLFFFNYLFFLSVYIVYIFIFMIIILKYFLKKYECIIMIIYKK